MMRRDQLIIAASVGLTALLAALLTWHVSSWATHRPDFAMMWSAMQQAHPYDREALDLALAWEARYPVAFVYPPTALPIFGLFGLFPLRTALIAWAALSGAAMALASRSIWTPLLLVTPAVLWVIPAGQTSVLMGSLLLGSMLLLHRPAFAGLLMGVALCLKPQLALAFVLLLLIVRRWDVLLAAGVTFLGLGLLSALLYGPFAWIEWARSLPAFLSLHESTAVLRRNEIAPGLPLAARAVALLAGAWAGAMALRRGNPVESFVIAGSFGLIGSAHAMGYEFAMFAPACAALIARRRWSASTIFLFLLFPAFIWAGLPAYPFRLLALLALIAAAAADGILAQRRTGARPDAGLASAAGAQDNRSGMVTEPGG